MVDFIKVGLTNHVTFHNLHLQSGHSYFATVRGMSFLIIGNDLKQPRC